jgi:hypothetical protein
MPEANVESKDYKLAVLIDGDNAQASLLAKMLAEIGKHGSVTIRRIYGDWTTSNMHSWKDALHNYAVQPIQQFRYTVGKNATDSALIIDAMDIMHRKLVEGFCIVSSDSDYTRLATRIREEGFFVMGIGQKKTPKSFVNGCDLFIYTENLSPKRVAARRSKCMPAPIPCPCCARPTRWWSRRTAGPTSAPWARRCCSSTRALTRAATAINNCPSFSNRCPSISNCVAWTNIRPQGFTSV